jgi:hypothetical protein
VPLGGGVILSAFSQVFATGLNQQKQWPGNSLSYSGNVVITAVIRQKVKKRFREMTECGSIRV